MTEHLDDVAHLSTCEACRRRAAEGLDVDLSVVWIGVAAEAWARPDGRIERVARWLLRSPGLARALVTTPSLVPSWILASIAVLAIGVLATESTGTPWVPLLAPALSGAAIAYAYGPGIDPAFELSRSLPISDRMVLLVRALAVFGLNAFLALSASLATPAMRGLSLGWLIPMTTISALGLAVATLARSASAGVAAALTGWALVVLGGAASTHRLAAAVTEVTLLPMYLAGTIGLALLALHASSGRRMEQQTWQ
ncbi:hypothetical protein NET02_10190 [Thermomicrobiaceae bacterium CFH 74404]|uniref:Uncharacterized protein n=1 Tax=Thermalbibacter longus TaxID=2951981 RepID=A0AA41WBC2_9BACT|nr:hypothetical protein [Thermalbibacter longus]MCM8749517.1 hypothetical protein [Thermalbibacter longus]